MDSPTRFVRSRDATRIAYKVAGEGPALVQLNAPKYSQVELFPQRPGMLPYLQHLGRGRTLITMDFRGTGMSERDVSDHSPEAITDDLEAVLDDLGITATDIVTNGPRETPAIRLAVRQPERVRRIVLGSPSAPRPVSPGHPGEPGMLELMESNWEAFLEMSVQMITGQLASELDDYVAFVRRCIDQKNFIAEIIASRQEEDWQLAALVKHPVLVMDPGFVVGLVPSGRIQAFAEQFPHGRFITHPAEHWKPPYSHATWLIQAIEEFFGPVPVANEALLPINAATLTPREREVLSLLAAGLTQPEVAAELCISPATVSRHVVSVYSKIGAHRRAEAVAWAIHHGLDVPVARPAR